MPQRKPRLLSINTYFYRRGGADAVFFDHDSLFRDAGWQTAAFAMHHPRNEPSEWSDYFVDEIEFGHAYSLLQKLSMAGKVVYSMEARRNLERMLDAFDADIAHLHCIYHHISPSILPVLKGRGIPIVMTAHDLKLACPAYKMLNSQGICEKCKGGNLLHLIANRCIRDSRTVSTLIAIESGLHKATGIYRRTLDRIVCPSRFYLNKLVEWGWPSDRLTYIPNFVQADKYQALTRPGRYFLYFGRLSFEKGVATLVKAALDSGVTLHIVGTGPELEQLRELALPAGERIRFFGYLSGEALWTQVRQARAVVLPSEWYENGPMSLLEAYALGKPVIGANIGGIPEMIKVGETGLLFSSSKVIELAECLTQLNTAGSSELEAMGRAAKEFVSASYSPGRYFNDMLGLYRELGCSAEVVVPQVS
jgi:glycosyltransferase involved in cell wall biosynthesis